ncbi:GNAT family N-acetyltransferase [Streptomyces sp. NPDC048664]|uniref:GNAT family N-acetyltransferase n=1 Tax=Streptomyces sp. NPDC048664 TaxID=3154505 RepID=UPI00342829D7
MDNSASFAGPRGTGTVRPAEPHDLPAVAALCTDHAAFERSAPVPADLATRLAPVLFAEEPGAWCLVADRGGEVIGYATWSLEFSTWRAGVYAHMDCLFVAESYRGEGWGRALLDAVRRDAQGHGVREVQWQTPEWNADAIGFYRRAGARGAAKVRFSLALGPPGAQQPQSPATGAARGSGSWRAGPCQDS